MSSILNIDLIIAIKFLQQYSRYNGNQIISDEKAQGDIVLKLGKNAKNVAIHAVGGGGAGGGISTPGASLKPNKNMTKEQEEQMIADLAQRFKAVTKVDWDPSEIVVVKNDPYLYKKHYTEIFTDKNGNYNERIQFSRKWWK